MKTIMIAILTLTSTIIAAQNTISWVGGTPGKETKWNEAKNWSNHRVPDEFSNVLIPDVSATTFASPVILMGRVELNSLEVGSNALLTIQEGARLVVFGNAVGTAIGKRRLNGPLLIFDAGERK